MKIKLYIVSYNNSPDLIANLDSIFQSNLFILPEIIIINNHSQFYLPPELLRRVKVLDNHLRPDFSTGHLSRNWNQALINGFKDLNNPDCDLVMHCQDDTIFDKDWLRKVIELHQTFNFVQAGIGDNFCSYQVAAIKRIGLWDERFCNLGYQEADYFLRALIYNRENSCLNDYQHGRILNPSNAFICSRPQLPDVFSEDHRKSMNYHYISQKVFEAKWPRVPANYWNMDVYNQPPTHSAISNFIYYPYFEKDIENLTEKKYLT